ncbi:MAG: TolB family protein, partial [Gemmatimonas sp.]
MSQILIRASFAAATLTLATFAPHSLDAQLRPANPPRMPMPSSKATTQYTIDQFLSPASPLEVSAAKKADRIAWVTYERGMRNIYTAAAPDFKALRLTKFLDDDGIDVSSVRLSDDGSTAIFVRGSGQNRQGWVANPTHNPSGGERAVWAARTDGSGAWRLAVLTGNELPGFGGRGGSGPELSPDGKHVVFARDGQLYHARVARGVTAPMDTGGIPFVKEWGRQSNPSWSPDGSKLAFVSTRDNHALIGIYDMTSRRVDFMSPSVDFDASPTWSPDGKRIAFVRRPGTPFAMQAQQGSGGIGNPAGPAAGRGAGRGAPGGGRGAGAARGGAEDTTNVRIDGLHNAAFPGGYTVSFMVADVATGKAQEFWHNQPNERKFNSVNAITWAGDNVVFSANVPGDEWDRYFSVNVSNPQPDPV